MRRIELVERKGDTAVIMIEEKTKHNTKYILERVNRIISIYYYLAICYYLVIYLIKGNFTIPVTFLFLIIFALFFLSGEGLRRRKVWGKSVALFTSLFLCFIELSTEIVEGKMINPWDFLIINIFGSLSVYLIVCMIIQKKREKVNKNLCSLLHKTGYRCESM